VFFCVLFGEGGWGFGGGVFYDHDILFFFWSTIQSGVFVLLVLVIVDTGLVDESWDIFVMVMVLELLMDIGLSEGWALSFLYQSPGQ
jgi:hypothetical protein